MKAGNIMDLTTATIIAVSLPAYLIVAFITRTIYFKVIKKS